MNELWVAEADLGPESFDVLYNRTNHQAVSLLDLNGRLTNGAVIAAIKRFWNTELSTKNFSNYIIEDLRTTQNKIIFRPDNPLYADDQQQNLYGMRLYWIRNGEYPAWSR